MPLHPLPLPPATRAVGTPNPSGDMNQIVNALNSRFGNEFHINDYGADPTGLLLSDTAWTNCYADATAALQTNSGAMIDLGPGYYKFTTGVVSISDARIGLRGCGRVATTIFTTSTGGTLVNVTGSNGGSQGCAPVSGFNLFGWNAGAGCTGLRYGDRLNGYMECSASGFGGTGARGFWFQDSTGNNSEGSVLMLASDNNTVCYDFDAVTPASGGSMDYSHLFLHMGLTTGAGPNVSSIGVRMQNGWHSAGSFIHLAGNVRNNNASFTTTVLQIGNSGTDTAHVADANFNVAVECDDSTGTVTDLTIQGASANTGILVSNGTMWFPSFGGTYTAGSITSPAVMQYWGRLSGPLFSGHGTLTSLGSAAAGLSTYVG